MFQQDMRILAWVLIGVAVPAGLLGLTAIVENLPGNGWMPQAVQGAFLSAGMLALLLLPLGFVLLLRAPSRPLA